MTIHSAGNDEVLKRRRKQQLKLLFTLAFCLASPALCADQPSGSEVDDGSGAVNSTAECCGAPRQDIAAAPAAGAQALTNFLPFTHWLPPGDRSKLDLANVVFSDQDGTTGELARFEGRPLAISFFYTRCDNERKCSTTVSHAAKLHRAIEKAGISDDVVLLLVSFEPEYDTPSRLSSYGKHRGIEFNENCRMIRLDPPSMKRVVGALDVPVNYNAGWVNIHGVALYLIDRDGRLARKYHSLIWNNDRVVTDLKTLIEEKLP